MSHDGSVQVLHKIKWKKLPNGGMLREYIHEEDGTNLLRLATIDEVVPNQKYYMVDPIKSNYFYETSFGSEVSWDTINEFVDTKKIYTRAEKKEAIKSINTDGPVQSALF